MLAEIKADDDLKHIPVVILTTSQDEQDVLKSYNLYANCYITKPVDLDQFITVVNHRELLARDRGAAEGWKGQCRVSHTYANPTD